MKKIKIIRILISIGIITLSFWISWRVIPTLGMFHILLNAPPAHIGSSLLYIVDGKTDSQWALEWVKRGWPLVWHEWPFVTIGVLFGWASGYPFGEFTRRKCITRELMPAKLRHKISQEKSEMRTFAFLRQWQAECLMDKANKLYADAQKKQAKIAAAEQRISVLRTSLEEQAQNGVQLRYDLESTKGELAKAKEELAKAAARNKKLKKKLRARLEKWIDEDETVEII